MTPSENDPGEQNPAAPRDIRDSHHDAEGDMGVSSERTGPAGPGQEATDGVRDVSETERDSDEDLPPEQTTGQPEQNPEGLAPKAGYPSIDPRSAE